MSDAEEGPWFFTVRWDQNTVHVWPKNDLIEHDLKTDECICGPDTEAIEQNDGGYGWLIHHQSMDGREFTEPDYEGPPMPIERTPNG